MVNWLDKKKTEDWLKWIAGLLLLILINQVASIYFTRIDLTEEKRFSIKPATKELLKNLDEDVYIEVFLEGELNSGFKRLQRSIKETLQEFEIYSNHRVRYKFTDPSTALSSRARNEFMTSLASRGITPTNVIDTRDGDRTERIIFPGALISYGENETGVMLLSGSRGEDQLNSSIENVEFNLASSIQQLTSIERPSIGFIQGHGELSGESVLSFQNALFEFYNLKEIDITQSEVLDGIELAIISKPVRQWSEKDKYKLDQFIMNGGKALFMLDLVDANMDSANNEFNTSFAYESKIEDMLFRYGIRVNYDLIQDNNAASYPIVVGNMGNQPQIVQLPWPFYPIVNRFQDHPISRNLDGVLTQFVSSIDTVKADGIRKTPLLFSSEYSRRVNAPIQVSVTDLRKNLRPEDLTSRSIPMAYLLEGSFTSIYNNRFLPENMDTESFISKGQDSKIVVISDGDFSKNDPLRSDGSIPELGEYQKLPGMRFANKDFLLNTVSYLLEENGLITARSKKVSIRPLDKVKVSREKTYWQFVNLVLPIAISLFMGGILYFIRRHRYTRFNKYE